MMKIKAVTDMSFYRYNKVLPFIFAFLFIVCSGANGQNRDNLPAEFREYTNPEEVVTFDRTTPFSRAIDVINEFAQEHRGKAIIDRTETSAEIGISVPAMHWMDALRLILRVKELHLVEQNDFFEIVSPESLETETPTQQATPTGGGSAEGEGPVATTQTHEVRINAIFFEGNRRALREIGVDWSTISENVPDEILGGGGQGGQDGGQSIPDSRFNGPFVQVDSKGAQNVSEDVFNSLINVGEIGNTGIRVQALFSAFEADNLGEILASPTVKVMDGQEGQIQVGQDFSIKQRDIAGNVVEQFFSVGTILTVTPQVITQQDTTFIHLNIAAERSSAQPDPVSTVINKQEAETQSLLLDGEATVIAGLYRAEQSQVRRGIPILKDLPPWFFGLRYLFGYNSDDQIMRELVIVLQASLEPSIPERYAKDELRNKYEVLRDERNRMQEEAEKGNRIMEGENVEIEKYHEQPEAEEPDVISQDEEDTETQQEQQLDKKEEPVEQDTTNKQDIDTENNQQEKEPAITDPEIKSEEIEIDLGVDQQEEQQQVADSDTTVEKAQDTEMDDSSITYYLIGGSFEVEENALQFRDKLENEGFDPVIIDMENSDIDLVAYRGYDNLEKARTDLENIQQNKNAKAWLYRAE
jgi:type IV pilus assembly protein PilQ